MIKFAEALQIKIFHSVDDCSSEECMRESDWNRLDGKGEEKNWGQIPTTFLLDFAVLLRNQILDKGEM